MEELNEGWGYPINSRKAHYFVDTMSLCRQYGFYRADLAQGDDNSPDTCLKCMKIKAKRDAQLSIKKTVEAAPRS